MPPMYEHLEENPWARLLESGDYSDLIIKCGVDTYNVHKAIVCTRSNFFRIACREGTFKVTKPVMVTTTATNKALGGTRGSRRY
ncbi:hypothetical protein M8818_003896 [Zalaria obscura]|uniref:Uncharacterized protein n=1 Tax=Zalaria obscura TaxID=2024903 RepID=A0ACC3SCY9_9PEZI